MHACLLERQGSQGGRDRVIVGGGIEHGLWLQASLGRLRPALSCAAAQPVPGHPCLWLEFRAWRHTAPPRPLAVPPTQGPAGYSSGEEGEEGAGTSDPTTKEERGVIYNVEALHDKLEEFGWSEQERWEETLVVTTPEPVGVENVEDDLEREMAFYNQALAGAKAAISRFESAGQAWARPEDYLAEMVKSDEHMAKIKEQLLHQSRLVAEMEQRCAGGRGGWNRGCVCCGACVQRPVCPLPARHRPCRCPPSPHPSPTAGACLHQTPQAQGARKQEVCQAGPGGAEKGARPGEEGGHRRRGQAAQAARTLGAAAGVAGVAGGRLSVCGRGFWLRLEVLFQAVACLARRAFLQGMGGMESSRGRTATPASRLPPGTWHERTRLHAATHPTGLQGGAGCGCGAGEHEERAGVGQEARRAVHAARQDQEASSQGREVWCVTPQAMSVCWCRMHACGRAVLGSRCVWLAGWLACWRVHGSWAVAAGIPALSAIPQLPEPSLGPASCHLVTTPPSTHTPLTHNHPPKKRIGFGGKKRLLKQNDAVSAANVDGYRPARPKGVKPGKKGAPAKNRPGKARRAAMKR